MPVVYPGTPVAMRPTKRRGKRSPPCCPSYNTGHRATSSVICPPRPVGAVRFACHCPLQFRSSSSAQSRPSSSDASFSALDQSWPRPSQPAPPYPFPRYRSRQRDNLRRTLRHDRCLPETARLLWPYPPGKQTRNPTSDLLLFAEDFHRQRNTRHDRVKSAAA